MVKTTSLPVQVCPFCGLTTDTPHETQLGCIDALHVEIARMRGVLEHVRPLGAVPNPLQRPDDVGV
jgi:hypothetical protein